MTKYNSKNRNNYKSKNIRSLLSKSSNDARLEAVRLRKELENKPKNLRLKVLRKSLQTKRKTQVNPRKTNLRNKTPQRHVNRNNSKRALFPTQPVPQHAIQKPHKWSRNGKIIQKSNKRKNVRNVFTNRLLEPYLDKLIEFFYIKYFINNEFGYHNSNIYNKKLFNKTIIEKIKPKIQVFLRRKGRAENRQISSDYPNNKELIRKFRDKRYNHGYIPSSLRGVWQ